LLQRTAALLLDFSASRWGLLNLLFHEEDKAMSEIVLNVKSDAEAKQAFIKELLRRGFDEAKITSSPADITARRGSEVFYFEIKYTTKDSLYFGAATLTEWEAALRNEDRYRFVVALKRDGFWTFHEYTPEEFMAFSSVPPFKVYFNIAVGQGKATRASRKVKRVQLTRERIMEMVELFTRFRSK
jgi:Holliday junction resolvase